MTKLVKKSEYVAQIFFLDVLFLVIIKLKLARNMTPIRYFSLFAGDRSKQLFALHSCVSVNLLKRIHVAYVILSLSLKIDCFVHAHAPAGSRIKTSNEL